jgi:hypothetical protein
LTKEQGFVASKLDFQVPNDPGKAETLQNQNPRIQAFKVPKLAYFFGPIPDSGYRWVGGSFCAVLLPIFLCEVGGGVDLIPEFIDLALHIN